MITNKLNSTLYTGVTNNLLRRIYEHKNKITPGFTNLYNCTKLVYFEETDCIAAAIKREKQIKKMEKREKKDYLINLKNHQWKDLSPDWF